MDARPPAAIAAGPVSGVRGSPARDNPAGIRRLAGVVAAREHLARTMIPVHSPCRGRHAGGSIGPGSLRVGRRRSIRPGGASRVAGTLRVGQAARMPRALQARPPRRGSIRGRAARLAGPAHPPNCNQIRPERVGGSGDLDRTIRVQPRPTPRGLTRPITASTCLLSCACPAVTVNASGTPRPSQTRWTFGPHPPRSRPRAWSAVLPLMNFASRRWPTLADAPFSGARSRRAFG